MKTGNDLAEAIWLKALDCLHIATGRSERHRDRETDEIHEGDIGIELVLAECKFAETPTNVDI